MFQTIELETEPERAPIMGSFRFFLFKGEKGAFTITYFIDHKNKKIHDQRFAGDECGFLDTPVDKREFTAARDYVLTLESAEGFEFCTYCHKPQLVM